MRRRRSRRSRRRRRCRPERQQEGRCHVHSQGRAGGRRGVTPRGHTAPMVLVAPQTVRPAPPGPVDRTGPGETSSRCCGEMPRRDPQFDPGLAGGLRAWLEDAAYEIVAGRGEHASTLFLGPRQLLGSPTGHSERDGGESLSEGSVLSRLVHTLLRQLVHTGEIDDPLCRRARRPAAPAKEPPWSTTSSRCPSSARSALAETLALPRPEPARPGPPVRTGVDATDRRSGRHPARRRSRRAARGLRPCRGLPQPGTASLCALGLATGRTLGLAPAVAALSRRCSRPFAAVRPRSDWRCSSRRLVATASRTCARSTSGPSPHTSPPGWPSPRPLSMIDRLTGALVAPVPAVDAASWLAALADAKSIARRPCRPARRHGSLPGHRSRRPRRALR